MRYNGGMSKKRTKRGPYKSPDKRASVLIGFRIAPPLAAVLNAFKHRDESIHEAARRVMEGALRDE